MVQLELDTAKLLDLGSRRRLPLRQVDLGYLVHCQMGEAFGDSAPAPFSVRPDRLGGTIRVLGYSDCSAEALRERADACAEPLVHAVIRWERFAGKPMPAAFAVGQRFAFEVRACPVVRMSSAGERHRKGAEVDAFLARSWAVGPEVPLDRGRIYAEWLAAQIERHGRAAKLLRTELAAFKRERLIRRSQGAERRATISERPDALLRGELEVTEPEAFRALLRRGIGRHRAFGFGMLLLRPAVTAC